MDIIHQGYRFDTLAVARHVDSDGVVTYGATQQLSFDDDVCSYNAGMPGHTRRRFLNVMLRQQHDIGQHYLSDITIDFDALNRHWDDMEDNPTAEHPLVIGWLVRSWGSYLHIGTPDACDEIMMRVSEQERYRRFVFYIWRQAGRWFLHTRLLDSREEV